MLTFMEFMARQRFFNDDLKLSDEDCLTESNKDTYNNYYLPIKRRLSLDESDEVRKVILEYLNNFKEEVHKLEVVDTKGKNNDEICKLYVDLPFGVVPREENLTLCSHDGKTIFNPKDMKEIIVDALINKFQQEGLKFWGSIKFYNGEYSIAYTITTRLYIPKYKEIMEDVYLKFDFRINKEGWQTPEYDKRHSKWNEPNRTTIEVPKKNSKLCAISIHQERSAL